MVWGMSVGHSDGARNTAYRLGWKAMPLALDDFDSNFVSMLGEEAMLIGPVVQTALCFQTQG